MKKLLLFVLFLLVVGYLVWRWWASDGSAQRDAHLVYDRVWIDHLPKNDRDTIQVFAAITEEPFGVFNASSSWKGSFEVFRYQGKGDEIRMHFPQNGDHETVKAKAYRCKENKMDFCLELAGTARGVKRYFSQEGWEIGAAHGVDGVRHRLDAIAHTLPAE